MRKLMMRMMIKNKMGVSKDNIQGNKRVNGDSCEGAGEGI